MKLVLGEFIRFLAAGLVNSGLSYAAFLILLPYLNYAFAYTVAFAGGILLSYLLNATFVFGYHSLGAFFKFPVIYLVQYLYGAIALSMLIELLGLPPEIAILIVIASSAVLTFGILRRVFAKPSSQTFH